MEKVVVFFLKTAVDEQVSAERYLSVDRCFSVEAVVNG